MRITKIKQKNEGNNWRVAIEWMEAPPNNSEEKERNWDKFAIDLGFPPLPSFKSALQDLVQDIVSICELSKEDAAVITPRSVSLSYSHGVMAVIITGVKDLKGSNGIVCINTPNKPTEAYSENSDDVNVLNGDTVARIEHLIEEAKRYVKGERGERIVEQQNLPFDQPDPDDENVKYVLADLLTTVCESCSPDLLANDKCKVIFIEDRPYVCTGTSGNATDGWEEARVWPAIKRVEFEGEVLSFQELPAGGNLRGHMVSSGRSKWVLTGEELTLKPEAPKEAVAEKVETPEEVGANDDPFAAHFPIPGGARVQ